MTNRPAEATITISALRALTGASAAEIARLRLPVKAGKTPLVAGIRAVLDQIRATAKDRSLAAAQDAARTARADAAEFDLAVDRGELVRLADLSEGLGVVGGQIMSRISTIPPRVTRDIPLRRKIETALREAQTEWAASLPAAFEDGPIPTPRRRK